MARTRRLEKGTQSVAVHPTEVDCLHQVVVGQDGESYLHLRTFASDERRSNPMSSQSTQLSRSAANELVQVMQSTFA